MRNPVPQATSSVRTGGSAASGRDELARAPPPTRVARARRTRPDPELPLVVFGRPPVVVLLHAPRVRAVLPLESVPNFSEGRDEATIDAIGSALGAHARLLDVHADADHNRSVFTLVGTEAELADALRGGDRGGGRADRPARARRSAPADRCRRRRPDRAAAPGGPGARARRSERRRRADRRRARPAGVRLRAARAGPGVLPARRHRQGFSGASTTGELAARLRPFAPARDGGRRDRRRTPAADRVQRQPARRRRVARAIAAVVREKGGGFPGVRALGLDLPTCGSRSGLDERRGLGGLGAARDRRPRSRRRRRRAERRSSAPSSSA